jgi:cytochrome c oxidase assembly protein subunit 15
MRKFKKFALAATVATYFQIFIGGLVRISGAGLGCPDWPTCFGRWFPPTNIRQLPADIDPAQFNFVLAWIEYVNRLIGMVVGLLIAITAIWALARMIRYPRIWVPSVLAALMVAYLGWQGGRMIAADLEPLLVSIHMGVAFIIACLMIYTTQQAYYLERGPAPVDGGAFGGFRLWILGLIVVSILQVFFGTEVRTALEQTASQFPLLPQSAWLGKIGAIDIVHTVLGIIVTLISWAVCVRIIRHFGTTSPLLSQTTWLLVILATAQAIIGVLLMLTGVPDLLQLYHLLLSSLFLGVLILVFSALRYERRTV